MTTRGDVVVESPPRAAEEPGDEQAQRPRSGRSLRVLLATRHPWWAELLLIMCCYVGYSAARLVAAGSRDAAMVHGRSIWDLERALGIAPERWLNNAVTGHDLTESVLSFYYQTMHFVVTPVLLVWMFRYLPRMYAFFRTAILIGSASAVVGFWLYPTAPPRFALGGFSDTVANQDSFAATAAATGDIYGVSLINLYAAMPSLHVGWAAWCALAVTVAARHWILRAGAWLYPTATTLVVLATANHYVLDAVAGVAVIAIGCLAAVVICRHRTPTAAAG